MRSEAVPLSTFLTFVASQGPGRLTVVRRHLDDSYDVRKDFYKRIREEIIRAECSGRSLTCLETLMDTVHNEVKKRNFKDVLSGYRDFHLSIVGSRPICGFGAPLPQIWSRLGLHIRVGGSMLLNIGDSSFLVKLYLKKQKLPSSRVQIVTHLMDLVLREHVPEKTVMAILDARRGQLLYPAVSPDIDIQLDGEAAHWSAIASRLDTPRAVIDHNR